MHGTRFPCVGTAVSLDCSFDCTTARAVRFGFIQVWCLTRLHDCTSSVRLGLMHGLVEYDTCVKPGATQLLNSQVSRKYEEHNGAG